PGNERSGRKDSCKGILRSCKTAERAGGDPVGCSCLFLAQDGRRSPHGMQPSIMEQAAGLPERGRALQGIVKEFEKGGASHWRCPQTRQVPGFLLTVHVGDAMAFEKSQQMGQRDLAGIGLPFKHGFPKKEAPQVHSVEAASKL